MALTGQGLANYAKSKVGTPYVYGAKIQDGPLTRKKLDWLKRNYPSMFTKTYYAKAEKFIGKVCTDCSGLVAGYTGKIIGSSQLKSTASKCVVLNKNNTKDIPVGAVLWKSGHVGVYIGDGLVAEALGINYGTVINKVSKRTFTHWLLFSYIKYDTPKPTPAPKPAVKKNPHPEPKRALKKGMKGKDVKWLQWELNESGFNCGKVDGIFGTNTEKAAIKFKKKYKYTTPTGGTTSTAIHNKLKTLH